MIITLSLFVVELYLSSEVSYRELALQEGIKNPALIVRFAIPIYGSAYVDYLPAPDCAGIINFRNPAVKKLWSASERLHNVNFPVLWRCWTYDECFSIGMNSLSYRATREKNAYLSISLNMGHSHKRGLGSQECYRFAEKVLAKELPFITPISEPKNFGDISFAITVSEDFTNVEAAIYYLTEPMQYKKAYYYEFGSSYYL